VAVHIVGHLFITDQVVDRLVGAEVLVGAQFVGACGESTAPQKMFDLRVYGERHLYPLTLTKTSHAWKALETIPVNVVLVYPRAGL